MKVFRWEKITITSVLDQNQEIVGMRTCPGRCLSSSCVIVAKLFFYADAPARATGRFERRLYAALACPMPTPGQGRSPSSDMIFVQYFTLPDFTP